LTVGTCDSCWRQSSPRALPLLRYLVSWAFLFKSWALRFLFFVSSSASTFWSPLFCPLRLRRPFPRGPVLVAKTAASFSPFSPPRQSLFFCWTPPTLCDRFHASPRILAQVRAGNCTTPPPPPRPRVFPRYFPRHLPFFCQPFCDEKELGLVSCFFMFFPSAFTKTSSYLCGLETKLPSFSSVLPLVPCF